MSNNRLIAIFAGLVLLVAAAFTIQVGTAPAPVVSNANDYPGRHPELLNSRINVEPMDWFQRHPESLNPGNAVDLSDYYARHPGVSIVTQPAMSSGASPSADPVNRRFPGKEQDDLVTTASSDEWHTPAYQGYSP